MEKFNLRVEKAIIKIIGVFEFENKKNELHHLLENNQFYRAPIIDGTDNTHKNLWYPEFRKLFIFEIGESSSKIYHRKIDKELEFILREDKDTKRRDILNVSVLNIELFTFKEGLHFFSIEVSINQKELSHYSDLTFAVMQFNKIVKDSGIEYKWVNWIEENCLSGIKIASTDKIDVKVDDYSGSKFKLFTVIDLHDNIDEKIREELLYDIGCGAKIGSAGAKEYYSPSTDYFKSLLKNKISVFSNYTILPLFDSFTVIGNNIIENDFNSYKRKTWSQSYFRIVLFNLFIKYNLFRYNSKLQGDSDTGEVELRDKFENFLNTYNFSHISYNFLPNLIFQNHKESLDIENELKLFQKRINRISQSIQEEQQKRSNVLLAIVGVVTSIGSVQPVFDFLESSRVNLNCNMYLFYFLVLLLLVVCSIPILIYAFPQNYKRLNYKWSSKRN
jgi:hypothetical protein